MTSKYKLSFTAGSLLMWEGTVLADVYLDIRDWNEVRQKAYDEDLLQAQRRSTTVRRAREVVRRLKTLHEDEVELLARGELPERTMISFLAVCRYYAFVRDFVLEVVRQNWLQFRTTVERRDYLRFYEEKEMNHEELTKITEKTRRKICQVLFRILAEAGLIQAPDNPVIMPPLPSPRIKQLVAAQRPNDLALLLLSDPEIEECRNRYACNPSK